MKVFKKKPMNETFLENLMLTAKKITHAERCMAVDDDLQVISMVNIDQETIESDQFNDFASMTLRDAMNKNEAIITNNVITDVSEAPTTNTNFANLRVVVAVPVAGHGAIYLDQHIRQGVIPKPMIERLQNLVKYLMQNQLESISDSEMLKLFQQIR